MTHSKSNFRLTRLVFLLWAGVSTASGLSCTKDAAAPQPATETPVAAETHLVSSTLIGEYSALALAGRVAGIPLVGALVRYPIRAYKLTYTTRDTDEHCGLRRAAGARHHAGAAAAELPARHHPARRRGPGAFLLQPEQRGVVGGVGAGLHGLPRVGPRLHWLRRVEGRAASV
ncbi:hypothetical protein [Hymenobacter elongatus]|uniref:hypothetical protein n=1 Tax=Hymenobacter elongatus TaxID=877208 RepID=UPI001FD92CF6|nr:hypothetical protein [Hymenobacter elongatus]